MKCRTLEHKRYVSVWQCMLVNVRHKTRETREHAGQGTRSTRLCGAHEHEGQKVHDAREHVWKETLLARDLASSLLVVLLLNKKRVSTYTKYIYRCLWRWFCLQDYWPEQHLYSNALVLHGTFLYRKYKIWLQCYLTL